MGCHFVKYPKAIERRGFCEETVDTIVTVWKHYKWKQLYLVLMQIFKRATATKYNEVVWGGGQRNVYVLAIT